jgi:DNA-binding XRE family transcriptional regulator
MDNSLKTKKEIAAFLSIDRKTIFNKEKNLNIKTGRQRLNPFEAQRLLDAFNLSKEIFKEKYGIPPNSPT